MPKEPRPRCGKWLVRAKTYCPLPENHTGRCRTPRGMKANYAANSARNRRAAEERYRWMDSYKTEHGCANCGYNASPRALDFDHEDSKTKVGNISRLIRHAPWVVVVAEMDKCTILCANCHRVKTFSPERRRPASNLKETDDGPNDEITGSPPGT